MVIWYVLCWLFYKEVWTFFWDRRSIFLPLCILELVLKLGAFSVDIDNSTNLLELMLTIARMLIEWSDKLTDTLNMRKSYSLCLELCKIIEPGTWLILTRHSKNLPSIILHYFKLKFQSAVLYFRMNVKIANFSAFIQEFRNWESAWALEALYVIVYEIRVLAEKVSNCLPARFFNVCVSPFIGTHNNGDSFWLPY